MNKVEYIYSLKPGPLMPSSHRRHAHDLSCECRRCELNWRQVKTVGDRKIRNWTCFCSFVPSRNAVWTELCLVRPTFQFATRSMIWCPARNGLRITTDKAHIAIWCKNCIRTCLQTRSHRRRDSTKLFSLKYTEDYWKLSWIVDNSVHTTDTTCRRCELGIRLQLDRRLIQYTHVTIGINNTAVNVRLWSWRKCLLMG